MKYEINRHEIIIVIGHLKTDHGLCGHNKASLVQCVDDYYRNVL